MDLHLASLHLASLHRDIVARCIGACSRPHGADRCVVYVACYVVCRTCASLHAVDGATSLDESVFVECLPWIVDRAPPPHAHAAADAAAQLGGSKYRSRRESNGGASRGISAELPWDFNPTDSAVFARRLFHVAIRQSGEKGTRTRALTRARTHISVNRDDVRGVCEAHRTAPLRRPDPQAQVAAAPPRRGCG